MSTYVFLTNPHAWHSGSKLSQSGGLQLINTQELRQLVTSQNNHQFSGSVSQHFGNFCWNLPRKKPGKLYVNRCFDGVSRVFSVRLGVSDFQRYSDIPSPNHHETPAGTTLWCRGTTRDRLLILSVLWMQQMDWKLAKSSRISAWTFWSKAGMVQLAEMV